MSRATLLTLLIVATGMPAAAGPVARDLEEALVQAGQDDFVPIVAMMKEFPARDELLRTAGKLNRENRRRHVVDTLREIADRTQLPVHALLDEQREGVRNVRVLWGINGVALEATPGVVEKLARLPQVHRLLLDRATGHPESSGDRTDSRVESSGPTGGDVSGPNPEASVAGEVVAMGAQQVWDNLSYTGAGVIVAVIDTGIDPTHPDLADHIWTNLGEVPSNGVDDDGNGYVDDTWGWDFCTGSNVPDGGSHGTQVAGQVAGDGTDGLVTGMAPDVELMALGIDCDTPSIGWEASDYAIAHGAHIITQSYSWWWTDQPDYDAFRRQTDTELAAGVIHANSAGNHGGNPTYPVPYNISTPANCPAPWLHPDQTIVGGVSSIIAVGNISWSNDLIASSSSLGPSAWEDIQANTDPGYPHTMAPEYQDYPYANGAQTGLIKPDLSAYGSGTTTTCPGSSYCGFSGTSSAAPHVSGTLALMLQSNPEATPAELAQAIMTTAEHRGDPGKNNVYGTGLVQAYAAVQAVESTVVYLSHAFDDTAGGNGDLMLDPGEQLVLSVTLESRTDAPIDGLQAILTSSTPGITIHDQFADYPTLAARGTATSQAPHFSLSVDPSACAAVAMLDLELRYAGSVRRTTFQVRVGDELPLPPLDYDFESPSGWTSDPGTSRRGEWVREDPTGVSVVGGLSNPEDDTTPDPGVTCWVTGSGGGNPNGNDVDDGATHLLSPLFGAPYILELSLAYDRWYYDNSSGGDSFKAEVSNDDGMSWVQAEFRVSPSGGWGNQTFDLMALLPPSEEMRVRFTVTDGSEDTVVEGAVDEVHLEGTWVDCQAFTPAAALAPNPVGETLVVEADPGGHARLTWQAPPVDGSHDAASLFRIERATSPAGPFVEVGSATTTSWMDVDAVVATETYHYRVHAENAGGSE